jgi:hypothetical protein
VKTFFEGGGREKREREKKASKFEIFFPAFFFSISNFHSDSVAKERKR